MQGNVKQNVLNKYKYFTKLVFFPVFAFENQKLGD